MSSNGLKRENTERIARIARSDKDAFLSADGKNLFVYAVEPGSGTTEKIARRTQVRLLALLAYISVIATCGVVGYLVDGVIAGTILSVSAVVFAGLFDTTTGFVQTRTFYTPPTLPEKESTAKIEIPEKYVEMVQHVEKHDSERFKQVACALFDATCFQSFPALKFVDNECTKFSSTRDVSHMKDVVELEHLKDCANMNWDIRNELDSL